MQTNRRNFLLASSFVALGASAVGYKDMLSKVVSFSRNGEKAKDSIYANAIECEGDISLSFNPNYDFTILNSVCNGCTSNCGVRVKVENKSQKVVKAMGNPYNPLSTDPWLPYNTPLKESFKILGKDSKNAFTYRSTVCARGNMVFDKAYDKQRVLKPLKRVGKRGEDTWEEISIEQLLEEIVQGGNLFNEGEIEGLKSIRNLKEDMDKNDPKKGSKANQLCILGTGDDGRKAFMIHRFVKSFGTQNYMGHTSICGLSMRSGEAAYLGDFKKYPHLKPDFENCEYLLTIGTAPAQAGNPFKRQAKLLAKARTEKKLKCVAVAPMLTNSDSIAIGDKSEWIPVLPGGDLAFVMGMIRVIIDEKLYNKSYLSIPSEKSRKILKDASFSNASHLIIQNGKNKGNILKSNKNILVKDTKDGLLKPAQEVLNAEIFVDEEVEIQGQIYKVKSAFTLLKESAFSYDLDYYAKESGISKEKIVKTAREFTSHGRKAAIDCHGGTMHTTGFYTTYAIMNLGAMIGNLNYKGGMSAGGGRYKDFKGERYNLLGYKGKVKTKGYRIDKARMAYEKTSEFIQKKEKGLNPYPAKDTWYPLTNALESEVITNSFNKYPYGLKALISWNANFIYGQSGSEHLKSLLKEPKKSIPLFIAIDPFINETSRFADYIVPDSIIYETWGVIAPWAGYQTKTNTLRFPTIKPKQDKFANGEPICMDSFMIELGKKLSLPGFGKNAIKGNDGKNYDLHKPSDFYIRAFENIALDLGGVNECSDEEIKLSGLMPYVGLLKRICGTNWRKTAFVMARGGRFESKEKGYSGDFLTHRYKKPVQVYNEALGLAKHSFSGKNFSGVPRFYKSQLANGEFLEKIYSKKQFPLKAFSYKSNVLSQAVASSNLIKQIRFSTYVDINPKTAKEFNVKHGQKIRLVSANGSIEGYVRFRHGVYPSCIAIEHGAGRDAEGAKSISINGKTIEAYITRKSGLNINKLGLIDKSRTYATLSDFVIGSNARQAIPVSIQII